ncbi:hypothetical protein BKA64DRAFT_60668 [Cadophora sp. MPI-SDFR-AT-0126]|nr:hypothetical protein BKA64DRAFT_60668 [Leotiomycetes sp. MPI-SDFR-AT-0126]
MEVVGAAASIVQLVSITAEVLALGYGYLAKAKRAPSEIRTLIRELTGLNELLDQLEQLATENQNVTTRAALEALEKLGTFEDCQRMVKVVQKTVKACQQIQGEQVKNIGKRLLWPFKDKETKETIEHLVRLRETLSAAVQVDSSKTLARLEMLAKSIDHNAIEALGDIRILQDDITGLKSATRAMEQNLAVVKSSQQLQIKQTERNDIRRWLRVDGIKSETTYQEALSQRHGATGSWILECSTFREWLLDRGACMWLYGIAGCGKTVLALVILLPSYNSNWA